MNSFYPISLNLAGKKIVIAGGGKVAERKAAGLLGSQAVITVVAPDITTKMKKMADSGQIHWMEKSFSYDDIQDAFMIFAATNDRELNQSIKDIAKAHQLVTIADDPMGSDFHVPAMVQRGRFNISISTGGASPTLAKIIREQLEKVFDESYEDYVEFLFQARQRILTEVQDPSLKRELLTEIVHSNFLKSENREADFLKLYEKLTNYKE